MLCPHLKSLYFVSLSVITSSYSVLCTRIPCVSRSQVTCGRSPNCVQSLGWPSTTLLHSTPLTLTSNHTHQDITNTIITLTSLYTFDSITYTDTQYIVANYNTHWSQSHTQLHQNDITWWHQPHNGHHSDIPWLSEASDTAIRIAHNDILIQWHLITHIVTSCHKVTAYTDKNTTHFDTIKQIATYYHSYLDIIGQMIILSHYQWLAHASSLYCMFVWILMPISYFLLTMSLWWNKSRL